MRRAGRLRELLVSGVVDSFGMALGWTVVVLVATARGGLAEAALYQAAMLGGVVVSAPVTGWLSHRFEGRTLLRGAAGIEVVLRFGVLYGLLAGAPSWLVAVLVVLMHVAAYAGFAGMRAEVTAVDASPRSMTRYAVCIAGVEAGGTALAALLPAGPRGHPTGWLLVAVFAVYLGSRLPPVRSARGARISPAARPGYRPAAAPPVSAVGPPVSATGPCPPAGPAAVAGPCPVAVAGPRPAAWRVPQPRLVLAGGGVMLLAAGPALLAVPLTAELHGGGWVAGAAVAFCLGTLVATRAVATMARLRLPPVLRWSLWGLGMLLGWVVAPLLAPLVLLAQFAAGLSQTAFEGDMDARVAATADPATVTRDLAYSASVRALGGAVAVRLLPLLVAAPAVGTAAAAGAVVLGGVAVILWATLTVAPVVTRRSAEIR